MVARIEVRKSQARGRAWLDEIVSGTANIEGIAARQKCSVRQVNMTISMAFIPPALVKAAVEGRLHWKSPLLVGIFGASPHVGRKRECVVVVAVQFAPVSFPANFENAGRF